MGCGLEGGDAFFYYEAVYGDVESFAEVFEAFFPVFGPVVFVAAAEEVVPDVLGLPEVDLEGEGAEGVGDGEGAGEGLRGGGFPGGGLFEADHGALHALACVEAEDGGIKGDLIAAGAGEEVFDFGGVEGVGLDGVAEAGVDGEVSGERECGRCGHAGFGEEVEQGGVVFVDFAEGVLHLGDGLVEDGSEDAVLLVGEEGGEGVSGGCGGFGVGVGGGFGGEWREEVVDEADDLGEVGAADGFADVGGEGGERGGLFGVVGVETFDGCGEVLVAEVEDGEADGF